MAAARESWRKRPLLGAAVAVAALALLLAGCGDDPQPAAAKAKKKLGPYECDAVGDGTPLSGHGNGSHVEPFYEGKQKGRLAKADCEALQSQFRQALDVTEGLDTRGAAEAAGWTMLAEYLPGLGTHHHQGSFRDLLTVSTFDPAKPTFLIYGGLDADAPLVGLSYSASGASDPPEAFAGGNDWWHRHDTICYGGEGKVLAGAEEIPDDECAALGGRNISLGPGIWLLHLWIVPDYELKPDVFASGHPCMGETEPLDRDDPCWDHIDRHPAEGVHPDHHDDEHTDGAGGEHTD